MNRLLELANRNNGRRSWKWSWQSKGENVSHDGSLWGELVTLEISHDEINRKYELWTRLLPRISTRENRMALERVIGLIFCHHAGRLMDTEMGIIHSYIKWETTFTQYLNGECKNLGFIKVWSGR